MGYMRIHQYGDIVEIYKYEKNRTDNPPRYVSPIVKARARKIREHAKKTGTYQRKKSSILRSVNNFFRLCHHNNCRASTVSFLTLTFAYDVTISEASRHIARFVEKIKKNYPAIPIRYISVPEYTKKNRLHFHLLVYNIPPEKVKTERNTRNFQRLFERGYVDLRLATYTSSGIAGYMAKYMAKSFTDSRTQTRRGYTCSRNIEKTSSYGSNTASSYSDLDFSTGPVVENLSEGEYDVKYLGKCYYTKIRIKQYE